MEFPTPIVVTILGLVCGGLGWWMRDLWDCHKQLRDELAKFKELVPQVYVSRHDYREDIREIKDTMKGIYLKLDRMSHTGQHNVFPGD